MTATTTAQTQYLTVREVAERLSLSRMTVYRLIDAGHLKALRLGRRTYRISAEAYADYLGQLEQDAEARLTRPAEPHPDQIGIDLGETGSGAPF